MKFLVTGASSFSGSYFVREILNQGHEVFALNINRNQSNELRRSRLLELAEASPKFNALNLDELNALKGEIFDFLLLHGSYMEGRRGDSFDIEKAIEETTNVSKLIQNKTNFNYIIHTGTFSEPNESIFDNPKSFNAYSTSKSLIYEAHKSIFRNLPVHKYVMPNPFGNKQNNNIFSAAYTEWKLGNHFFLKNPWVVRDFVPVDLLAKDYYEFITIIHDTTKDSLKTRHPSLYVESLASMLERFAFELKLQSNLECEIVKNQIVSSNSGEPRIRINFDFIDYKKFNWNQQAWWHRFIQSILTTC